jgi:hypothetical protein
MPEGKIFLSSPVGTAMSHDSPVPNLEALDELRAAIAAQKGWPLDERQTFAALVMMGLASRLQPLQLNDSSAQVTVVDLAFKLADMAVKK